MFREMPTSLAASPTVIPSISGTSLRRSVMASSALPISSLARFLRSVSVRRADLISAEVFS
jgi:hypothetical protein